MTDDLSQAQVTALVDFISTLHALDLAEYMYWRV